MMSKPKLHRFKSVTKSGRKGRRGQRKQVRVGSRAPGASGIGSIRHPH